MPTLFTMHANVSDFIAPDLVAAEGMHVHFDLNIEAGALLRSLGTTPALVDFRRAVGYIRSDGRMYDTRAVSSAPFDLENPGNLGVRLLANDPDFGLDPGVSYRVRFERVWQGRAELIASFYTPVAPSVDTEVNLAALAPGPGLEVVSVPDLGLVDHLADAGTVGKDVVRAASGTEVFEAMGGWPTLGVAPAENLPSYVDDVVEFDSLADFPAMGETGKLYLAKDTNIVCRWTGSKYLRISAYGYAELVDGGTPGASTTDFLDGGEA